MQITKGLIAAILLFFLTAQAETTTMWNANPDPNGEPWMVGPEPELTDYDKALLESAPRLQLTLGRDPLPPKTDNYNTKYFRSIFNQIANSCAQASGIAYLFTYEMNALRGLDAAETDNQYPYFFTYNFIDGDGAVGSWYWTGFDIVKKLGVPNVTAFGGFDNIGASGWASGYDIYNNAMTNRISDYYSINIKSPEGLETLKQWMHDHGRDDSLGGVSVFAAMAIGITSETLPAASDDGGKKVCTRLGNAGFHAMTFTDYNDDIMYDLNGDGQFTNDIDINDDGVVDMKDWERGALRLINSWGKSWGDEGTMWVLYSTIARYVHASSGNFGGIYRGEVWVADVVKENTPTHTLKVSMKSEHRNQLIVTAGLAPQKDATTPTVTQDYGKAFNNAGKDYPMLGKGKGNTIEFGLDVSDLIQQAGSATEMTLFLAVDASGSESGEMLSLELRDYTGTAVKTFPCSESNVVLIGGKRYFAINYTSEETGPVVVKPITDKTIDEDDYFSCALREVFSGNNLTFTSEGLPTSLPILRDSILGTPTNDDVGEYTVVIKATDDANKTVEDTFTLTINNVNDIPVVKSPLVDTTTKEDKYFTKHINDVFDDIDLNDTLELAVYGLPSSLQFYKDSIWGTPGNNDVGAHEIHVTATDLAGKIVEDTFNLTIENMNDAPVAVGTIDDQRVTVPESFSLDLTGLFEDIDVDDTLTLSVSGLPAAFTIIDDELVGDAALEDTGSYTGTITATDVAEATALITFAFDVKPGTAIWEVDNTTKSAVRGITVMPTIITDADQQATFIVSDEISGEATIVVYDALGNTIDEQAVVVNNGGNYVWDLTNGNGTPVGAGSYLVVLTVTDVAGVTTQYKAKIGLQR